MKRRGSGECEGEEEDKEGHIRILTGGPLYSTEEPATIRDSFLTVLSTILSTIQHHRVIIPYPTTLVQLGIHTIQLDWSWVVRISVVVLMRELYSLVLQ